MKKPTTISERLCKAFLIGQVEIFPETSGRSDATNAAYLPGWHNEGKIVKGKEVERDPREVTSFKPALGPWGPWHTKPGKDAQQIIPRR